MTTEDKYWLAGILEGEGSFIRQTERYPLCIAIEMTDRDVVERVAKLMNDSTVYPVRRRNVKWKDSYRCNLRGNGAKELMEFLLPIMGERRRLRIIECIASFSIKLKGKLTPDDRVKILARSNERPEIVGAEFGVTKWRVYQIWRGE